MAYIGQAPGLGEAERFLYTATGTGTAVTAADDGVSIGYTVGQVSVYLNGVKQVIGSGKDVTATDGSQITFLAAYAADDVIEVIALSTFSPADTVPATGGTFTGNVTHSGDLRSGTLKAADGTAAITIANSTGVVTASAGVVGNVTGNVTGNASGTAATVTTAAQSAITSVGTLTAVTVTGLITANGGIETDTNSKIIQRGEAFMKTLHNSWVMGG